MFNIQHKTRTKEWGAICAAFVGLGAILVGCDGDGGGTDAGVDSGPPDSGMDTGVEPMDAGDDAAVADSGEMADAGQDAGQDAGPPPAYLRLAHLIPNVPGEPMGGLTGLIHLCLAPATMPEMQLLITRDAMGMPRPIPYGGVSDYTNRLPLLPISYRVYVYRAADVGGSTCPATATALFHTDVDASGLMAGAHYTIAAVGLIRPGASRDTGPKLVVVRDDLMEPAAGMTRVRFINGLANIPGGANIDVCYDPDFAFGPAGMPEPGPMPGVLVQGDLQFLGRVDATMVPYVERAPIGSGSDPAGYLFVYPRGATETNCAEPPSTPIQAIPIPIPVPPPGTPGLPPNITATIDAGRQVTIFLRGDVAFAASVMPLPCDPTMPDSCSAAGMGAMCHPVARRCVHPQAPTVTPWIDVLPGGGG